jgi:hypothetical protein
MDPSEPLATAVTIAALPPELPEAADAEVVDVGAADPEEQPAAAASAAKAPTATSLWAPDNWWKRDEMEAIGQTLSQFVPVDTAQAAEMFIAGPHAGVAWLSLRPTSADAEQWTWRCS